MIKYMKILAFRKTIINEFAKKIADIQKRADIEYYKPHLEHYEPVPNENSHAAWLLDQVTPLKEMCQKLGIAKRVYEEAYKIYDFRNSGKDGYTLIDGKIVKAQLP
jgi:hypothetical protein